MLAFKLALAATLACWAVIENSDKTLQIFRFRILGLKLYIDVQSYQMNGVKPKNRPGRGT